VESFGLPSLLIPSPYVANNHQFYNAKSLFDKNACDMLLEEDIHDDVLNKHVFELIRNKQRLVELGHNARKLATPDAVSNIADLVEKVVGNDDASQ
ncbi:glycosyltransferase, partial [Erysipelothrix rhusiopathiae]|nr:glycosyltransferase [Erysipelothrix rhusiopathiae]